MSHYSTQRYVNSYIGQDPDALEQFLEITKAWESPAFGPVSVEGGLEVEDTLYLKERAAADDDVAGWGQVFVKTGAPNTLYFADEDGTEWLLNGVPTTVTVANSTDASSYMAFFEDATGDLGPKTNAAFTVNATADAEKLTIAGQLTVGASRTDVPLNMMNLSYTDTFNSAPAGVSAVNFLRTVTGSETITTNQAGFSGGITYRGDGGMGSAGALTGFGINSTCQTLPFQTQNLCKLLIGFQASARTIDSRGIGGTVDKITAANFGSGVSISGFEATNKTLTLSELIILDLAAPTPFAAATNFGSGTIDLVLTATKWISVPGGSVTLTTGPGASSSPTLTWTTHYGIYFEAQPTQPTTGYSLYIAGTGANDRAFFGADIEVDGDFDHDGTNFGVFTATPVAQRSGYTQTYSTADKTHAARTYSAPVAVETITGYTPPATGGGVTVTSIAATDLDTASAALDTLVDEVTNLAADVDDLRTQVVALAADQQDTAQFVNAIFDDLELLGFYTV